MTSRTQKIEALRIKLQQLEAAEKAAEARSRAAANKQVRTDDTRRKILLGAFVLERIELAEMRAFEVRGAAFGAWLTRPSDRGLFGLSALPPDGAAATPAGGTHQLPDGAR